MDEVSFHETLKVSACSNALESTSANSHNEDGYFKPTLEAVSMSRRVLFSCLSDGSLNELFSPSTPANLSFSSAVSGIFGVTKRSFQSFSSTLNVLSVLLSNAVHFSLLRLQTCPGIPHAPESP